MATTLKLTTVFTPPSSCLGSTFTLSPSGSDIYASGTVTRGLAPECFPSYFRSVYEQGTIPGSPGSNSTTYESFYSPGICPSGYTTETAQITSSMLLGTCCPSGYTVGLFTFVATEGPVRQVCVHTIMQDVVTLIAAGASNQKMSSPAVAVASAVQIAYDLNDQSIFAMPTTHSSTNSNATPSGVSPVESSDVKASTATPPAAVSRGLDSGVKAGIGVGVSLAVILVLAGASLVTLRWRKRRQHERPQQETDPQFEKAELPGSTSVGKDPKAELATEGNTLHEASDAAAKPPEMDSMNVLAELPGGEAGVQAPGPGEC